MTLNATSKVIGVNGLGLTAKISSGIPRVTWEICQEISRQWPSSKIIMYVQERADFIAPCENWVIREEPTTFFQLLKPNLWLRFRCGMLAARDNIDVFYSASGLLPILPRRVPSCLYAPDVNIKVVPETMSRFTRIAFGLFFEKSLLAASAVLAGSRGTAEKLLKYYGVRSEDVVPLGAGPAFRPHEDAETRPIRERYGITGPFMLAVGTIEPRKNILNLLRAFDILDQAGKLGDCKLALVGRLGWKNDEILSLIAAYEGRWLRRLGYVPDEDLAKLYSSTKLFVFPSAYEGFGLPVIEARSCGARLAVTDIPELREYCGEDAILLPGTSAQSIASALEPALEFGKPQSTSAPELPTWELSAQITIRALKKIIATNFRSQSNKA